MAAVWFCSCLGLFIFVRRCLGQGGIPLHHLAQVLLCLHWLNVFANNNEEVILPFNESQGL